MIRGRIRRNEEPLVPLVLLGRGSRRVEAILDTGFTGYLCLARRHRRGMALVPVGTAREVFADGRTRNETVYAGDIRFDGRRQRIPIVLTGAEDSLVGTRLLQGKRLRINFRTGEILVADA